MFRMRRSVCTQCVVVSVKCLVLSARCGDLDVSFSF
jgi:hypothetical protein